MSSSQLTNSIIFQRGRYTTKQIKYDYNQLNYDISLCINYYDYDDH